MSAKFEPITGRYMHLDLFGRRCCACTPPAATGGSIAA